MTELNTITKCPFCNKFIYDTISTDVSYEYEGYNKRVHIVEHCNKQFISHSIHITLASDILKQNPDLSLLEVIAVEGAFVQVPIEEIQSSNIVPTILSILKQRSYLRVEDKIDNYTYIIKEMKKAFDNMNFNDIFSEPLTEDIKRKLKDKVIMCW